MSQYDEEYWEGPQCQWCFSSDEPIVYKIVDEKEEAWHPKCWNEFILLQYIYVTEWLFALENENKEYQ